MKFVCVLAATLLLTAPAVAEDAPSLLGTWTGEMDGTGAQDGRKVGPVTLVIGEQQGRSFTGKVSYPQGNGEGTSTFYGSIAPDGHTLSIADEDGAAVGTVDGERMQLCYIESGADASSACVDLTRQK